LIKTPTRVMTICSLKAEFLEKGRVTISISRQV